MELRKVSTTFAVSPQLQPIEIEQVAKQGYVALICNRPDGEEEGQPLIADLRAAAEAVGLAFHHIPVSGGKFPEAAITAFGAVRKGTQGPVLAFCRTGTRSITLDTLANVDGLSVDDRLTRAQDAGYDLSMLKERLS